MKNVLRLDFTEQGLKYHCRNDPANTSSINRENSYCVGHFGPPCTRYCRSERRSSSFDCVRDNFAEFSNGNRAILSRIHLLASGLVREVTSVLAYAFLDL